MLYRENGNFPHLILHRQEKKFIKTTPYADTIILRYHFHFSYEKKFNNFDKNTLNEKSKNKLAKNLFIV